ncbi:Cyclase family protein [Paraburkholderia piptadeniae]|uniref:Cyclase family protein n=2 Tax=Paraburkholderia TaxID=1822464 RepID=A0A7X1TIP0_9BURK|nr:MULTISPECIES: cyclase family protein [Paraburkholderia]MPW20429.1 cyclase family protein [Paraburkholderia franconis]SIT50930.1 Cyclase family protein [Paraburkholderia piptadeniae]
MGSTTATEILASLGTNPFWTLHEILKTGRWVDLSHTADESTPLWSKFTKMSRSTLFNLEEHGFQAHVFTHVGQWGTHVDPPSHFHGDLRSLDQLAVREQFLPLVVIDIHAKVAANPDYTVSMDDVKDWELRNGAIPRGAFVALRTDWSKRWPDHVSMMNLDADGVSHTPGWSREVIDYLFDSRDATACGHETLDTDPGAATSRSDFSLETLVLSKDRYQVELLANLSDVPEAGGVVVVAFPKVAGATGFPARVFAIAPL